MSAEYDNTDPITLAKQAEADLNSLSAKGNKNTQSSDSSKYPLIPLPHPCPSLPFPFSSHPIPFHTRADPPLPSPALESGIDESATTKFPGATVSTGPRDEIPESEGGSILPSGKPTKASDFEGVGGPEDKARLKEQERGGDDEIRGNVRQGGETKRP